MTASFFCSLVRLGKIALERESRVNFSTQSFAHSFDRSFFFSFSISLVSSRSAAFSHSTKLRGSDYERNYISGVPSVASCRESNRRRAAPFIIAHRPFILSFFSSHSRTSLSSANDTSHTGPLSRACLFFKHLIATCPMALFTEGHFSLSLVVFAIVRFVRTVLRS